MTSEIDTLNKVFTSTSLKSWDQENTDVYVVTSLSNINIST